MVTTRHKAAVESGEAPATRKRYKEVGEEEFEEIPEHGDEHDESAPKKGKKGKKGGAAAAPAAAAAGKKRGRPAKKKRGAAARALQREEQSPTASDEEAKRMRTAGEEEGAPQQEQPQLEQPEEQPPQQEEEMLFLPQQEEEHHQQLHLPPEPETEDNDELAKHIFQEQEEEEEEEEPETQAEQDRPPPDMARVLETQPPEEEKAEQPKSEEEAAPPATPATANIEGTVEQGRLLFFYRPKVEVEEASSLDQVQRFYMIFAPQEGSGRKPRLAVIGKKRLPKVSGHERVFGFIEAVGESVEDLTTELGSKTYETKTRGTRHVAAARAVGEASYAIVNRGGSGAGAGKTHLILKLLVPQQPGEVQEDLAIPQEGFYAFSIKNPENKPSSAAQGGAIGLEEKADFTKEKKKEFGNYAWIGVTDPSLLEFERCEFLLVAATEDVQRELGAPAEELTGGGGIGGGGGDVCAESDEECLLEEMKKEINGSGKDDVGVEMQPVETGEWK